VLWLVIGDRGDENLEGSCVDFSEDVNRSLIHRL
jgi:hypothetical protein